MSGYLAVLAAVLLASQAASRVNANGVPAAHPAVQRPAATLLGWGGFGINAGEFNDPWGLTAGPSGRVYVADTGNHRVQVFEPDGTAVASWGGSGSAPGQLFWPSGIAVDTAKQVYVTDRGNHRVQVFDAGGQFLRTWCEFGAAAGQFASPQGIGLDASGNVYVTDTGNHRVQVFNGEGGFLRVIGVEGSGSGQFNWPAAVVVDAAGQLYVADRGNDRIQQFSASGGFLRAWGASGAGDGQLESPSGLAFDAAGRVYVADTGNRRVQVFTPEGVFLGSRGAVNGSLLKPRGVAVDAVGQVFVADSGANRVEVFVPPYAEPQQPANGKRLEHIGTALQWSLTAGMTQYHLQITPFANDGPGINIIRNAATGYTIEPPVLGAGNYVLLPDMTYTWRVRATAKPTAATEDDQVWGPWSDPWSFRTPQRSGVSVSAVSPVDNTAVASLQPLALQWRDTQSDVFYYEVQASTDPEFGEKGVRAAVWNNLVHGGVASPLNSWTTPPLDPASRYYWRVRPRIQGDGAPTDWSRQASFTTP